MYVRKALLAAAAIAVVAAAFTPTVATAWSRVQGDHGYPIGLNGIPGAGPGYYNRGIPVYGYGGYGGSGCWRQQVIETPFGPIDRRVWVCG